MRSPALAVAWFLSLLPVLAAPAAGRPGETRISIDFKDADILDIVRLMAEVGDFQVVADPGVACKLTLKLKEVPLQTAFDVILRSCGLGHDDEGGIVRVAPTAKLTAEHAEARKLEEARALNRPLRTQVVRLSYARAAEIAPLLKRFLSPRGDVTFDARTNTLFVTDIE
ncbi:MAG TPA: secretin N-terminal domain-containing protein [Vicinamibacteria bacterium]|nr:secretin N-terminal domain-containing protein [Vicinamibacteria bacterium]